MGFPFFKVILKGISQVMLQNNALTGFLLLVGVLYNSWMMAAMLLAGVVVSTLTAYALNYPRKDIEKGLYGFNGALVGVALAFFFQFNLLLFAFIIAGSALSSVVMNFMLKKRLPAYTFPFVIVTWASYLIISLNTVIPKSVVHASALPSLNILLGSINGFGQVMFQDNVVTGIIFLIAIIASSRVSALYAVVGTLLGLFSAFALGLDVSPINSGIFGFNAVLCGIAFAGDNLRSTLSAVVAIILSVMLTSLMLSFSLITLTFPFVLATWITLLLKKSAINKL